MQVPFVDLRAQYLTIKNDMDRAMSQVIDETAFISGKYAATFETEFAHFLGVKNAIACANGTDSLEILLRSMGVGNGDEVLVPAISWISTSEAVTSVGATPVFVDIDQHFLMDLDKIEQAITSKTRAIIPVHLYGNPIDMQALMSIAEKHKLLVMEDCAQAHAATSHGKMVGSIGHCSSFSFYPGKNLGAYGDAGAMATNDDAIADTARAIANHGQKGKHNHIMEGRNSRLDGIQAAVLSAKLPHLQKWTEARIAHAKRYTELLKNSPVITPLLRENMRHVFHLYVIRTPKRNELMEHLKSKSIETAIHYPVPLPLMPCYKHRGLSANDFPVAAALADEILSLPMYAELSNEQIEYVANTIHAFFA